jgi:hypothetical protein
VIGTALTSSSFAEGRVVREPAGQTEGYWAGAPGAFYAEDERAWYLTYRLRRPRGVSPDRGGEARIARSTDLVRWDDVWTVTKDRYRTASIERSTIRKGPDGQWRYFTSYVDPADGRWSVALLTAPGIHDLNPDNARTIFTAAPLGLEGIKDPWIIPVGTLFYMFVSVALPTSRTTGASHATLDIYNTGECVSATGLAVSSDLDRWTWQGVVFSPDANGGWDRYCRRINSVIPVGNRYLAFYDGSAGHHENYEEKTGLAWSSDLRVWTSATPDGPAWTSPHATGALRYFDAQPHGTAVLLFYECARADGAHDLRVIEVPAAAFGT